MNRIDAAQNALLVMYAFDNCQPDIHVIPPVKVDPRVTNAGYDVLGWITGSDVILSKILGIPHLTLGTGGQTACYGFVVSKNGQITVVIRGTSGILEWADDAVSVMIDYPHQTANELVDSGFWDIYSSMQFYSAVDGTSVNLASGIARLAGAWSVMVLGHSLGSALATYLTLDLALSNVHVSACMFASPKTGNQDFVKRFEAEVTNYDVFNYAQDTVPTLPPPDILHFTSYQQLLQAKTIPQSDIVTDEITCNHHLISYVALLDHPTFSLEMTLDKSLLTPDDVNCAKCVVG